MQGLKKEGFFLLTLFLICGILALKNLEWNSIQVYTTGLWMDLGVLDYGLQALVTQALV